MLYGFFFFIFSGAGEGLTDKLSDEVLSKIDLGRSAFKSVSKKFLSGEIQIKGLLKIFQRKQEFLDFLKIGEYNYLFFPSVSHVFLCFLSLNSTDSFFLDFWFSTHACSFLDALRHFSHTLHSGLTKSVAALL